MFFTFTDETEYNNLFKEPLNLIPIIILNQNPSPSKISESKIRRQTSTEF